MTDKFRLNGMGPDDFSSDKTVPFQSDVNNVPAADEASLQSNISFTGMLNSSNLRPKITTVPDFENVQESPGNISFTGLIDRGLVESRAFNSWLDGISPLEIKPTDIQEIANHIAEEFSQAFPDVKMQLFSGGFATNMQGNGTLFYDALDVIKNDKVGYGAENIVGSIAHEMGHNIVERVFADSGIEISRLQHEIGADFIEGVVFGMTDMDPSDKFDFLRDVNIECSDYLSAEGRIDVIEKGIEWGDRLQLMGTHAPELMLDISSDEVLRRQLLDIMNDYTDIG